MQRYSRINSLFLLLLLAMLLNCADLRGQWHIPSIGGVQPNSAAALGNDCFQLTGGGNQRGVVWDSVQLDLSQPFDITLNVNQQPFGADGLALVLQNAGLAANGAGSNALGFGNSIPAAPGYGAITNSIAFEVDTWDNSGAGVADIPQDHVAIHVNGNMTTTIGAPVAALASGTDITDGLCHRLRVTWNPSTANIRIFFDANPVPRINVAYNITANVFGGNPLVWWGITGGSGGAAMTQTVCVGANFAQAGSDRHICPNDTVQLQGSGGTTFNWLPIGAPLSANTIPNPRFAPSPPGTYPLQLTVTNSALCTDIDSVIVTVEPFPVANAGSVTQICIGDSALLGAAPNPSYSYLWQPGSFLSSPTVAQPWLHPAALGPLNYSLIVTALSGTANCRDTALITITVLDTPSVSLSAVNDTLCLGQSALLSATPVGSGPFSYLWSNGPTGNSQTVSPVATTNYSLQVSDAFGCGTVGNITVVVNDTPAVTVTALPDTICAGQTVALSATVVGGNPGYSYLWTSGANAAFDTIAPLTSLVSQVTVTDALGCSGLGAAAIVVNVSDSIDIVQADTFFCLGGSLQVQNTFGTAGINAWQWTPSTGVSNPNSPNPLISPNATTTYALSGTNTLTGCGYTDSLKIGYNPLGPPVVNLGNDTTFCTGGSLVLQAGNAGFSYLWSDGSTASSYVASAQGWVVLTVSDTVGCGYLAMDSVLLNVLPLPQPDLGPDAAICPHDSLLLSGHVVASSYLWSTGAIDSSIWTTTSGLYHLQVVDSNGCSNADTVLVSAAPIVQVTITGLDPRYCIRDSAVQLGATPGNGRFFGDITPTGYFDPGTWGPGQHPIQYLITDSLGCIQSDSSSTFVASMPSIANAGPDAQGPEPVQLAGTTPTSGTGMWTLLSGSGGQLSDPGAPQASLSQLAGGNYVLVWTISNPPCPANSDTVLVYIESLFLPTGFSPNGDGQNDQYVIRGLGAYPDAQLSIFNRWGNLVWSASNYQNDWDGRNADGYALVEDTYYAILTYGGKAANTFVVLKR